MTVCLAEYRAGNYSAAAQAAREGAGIHAAHGGAAHYAAGALAVQAMTAHGENDLERARTLLEQARTTSLTMKMVNQDWWDIMIAKMLLEEATALIGSE